MPMIDVFAVAGTFGDKRKFAQDLASTMMRWEKVPDIALFRNNTAAFVHDLSEDAVSNVSGDNSYVRIQILTPAGVLDREKKLGVTKELTDIAAAAAGDPSLVKRTWVLITEAPDGGWGIAGRALTSSEIRDAAKSALAG